MKKLFLLLSLLTGISCSPSVSKKITATEKYDVQVILLAGQSNMAGCGNYDALEDGFKQRIQKAGESVRLSIDGKPPRPLSYSYSKYQEDKRGFGNVFGPELFLGLTLAEQYPAQEFLFIKKAQGGTALYGAWNPEWTAEKAAAVEREGFKREIQLYREHHQQIKAQLAALETAGKSYKIAGLFWMQGENDAAKEIAARSYEANLKKLIAGYRKEFKVPGLAFVMGQINSSYGRFSEGPEMVRNAMLQVAKTDKRVGLVQTSMDRSWADFPKHEDNVHYNHIGQMRLGTAFAEEWMALNQDKPKVDQGKPNVLLIMVDDMNDWVGAFGGHPQAITPNMDKFADKSVLFKNAYCSAPLCNPSRTSMLTGYLPSTTGVYGNGEHFRDMPGFENVVTLPQYFSQNGYKTAAAGKIFHSPRGAAKEPKKGSDPGSFQIEKIGNIGSTFPPDEDRYQTGLDLNQKGIHSHLKRTFDWAGVNEAIEATNDWKSANFCAGFLEEEHDKPFFLACGIFRPHLPWYVPQAFFDLYDGMDIQVPQVKADDLEDVGEIGKRISQKVLHKEVVKKNKWQEAAKAYLANLSYADACLGHLLKALEKSNYYQNTIVVIMGDHGWHLGEKAHWTKNTLWEESAKTPLMIYTPNQNEGAACNRIVSLLDVYPTLVDLCGLPEKKDLEGQSIRSLLANPQMKWDNLALTTKSEGIHSLRSNNYRYTVYTDGFEELYDHRVDPMEWKNLALDTSNKEMLEYFRKELESQLK